MAANGPPDSRKPRLLTLKMDKLFPVVIALLIRSHFSRARKCGQTANHFRNCGDNRSHRATERAAASMLASSLATYSGLCGHFNTSKLRANAPARHPQGPEPLVPLPRSLIGQRTRILLGVITSRRYVESALAEIQVAVMRRVQQPHDPWVVSILVPELGTSTLMRSQRLRNRMCRSPSNTSRRMLWLPMWRVSCKWCRR